MSNPQPVTYIAIHNVPGYLADGEPTYHDTAAEAWTELWEGHELACHDADEDVPLDVSHDFAEARHNGLIGSITVASPGYDGDHDLGIAYTVEKFDGVICVDCGARFAHTDEASAHWLDAHLEGNTP